MLRYLIKSLRIFIKNIKRARERDTRNPPTACTIFSEKHLCSPTHFYKCARGWNALPDVDRPIEWVSNRIEEIELSRNIVAHHNPLSDDDIQRVKIFFKDWTKQFSKE